jgi:hypothetical protein
LQCTVLPAIGIACSIVGCSPVPRYIAIKNTLNHEIAAGTVYTYALSGAAAATYQNTSPLPPGQGFTIQVVADPPDTCTASIPGSPYTLQMQTQPLTLQAP